MSIDIFRIAIQKFWNSEKSFRCNLRYRLPVDDTPSTFRIFLLKAELQQRWLLRRAACQLVYWKQVCKLNHEVEVLIKTHWRSTANQTLPTLCWLFGNWFSKNQCNAESASISFLILEEVEASIGQTWDQSDKRFRSWSKSFFFSLNFWTVQVSNSKFAYSSNLDRDAENIRLYLPIFSVWLVFVAHGREH